MEKNENEKKPLPIVSIVALSLDGGAVLLFALGTLILEVIGWGIGWLCYLLGIFAILSAALMGVCGAIAYIRSSKLGLVLGLVAFALPAIFLLVLILLAQNGIAIIRFM